MISIDYYHILLMPLICRHLYSKARSNFIFNIILIYFSNAIRFRICWYEMLKIKYSGKDSSYQKIYLESNLFFSNWSLLMMWINTKQENWKFEQNFRQKDLLQFSSNLSKGYLISHLWCIWYLYKHLLKKMGR